MIEFINVSKRYQVEKKPGKCVLDDVSLTLPTGRSIGVVGEKGSGKSTFLKLLMGTELPTQGEILRDVRIETPTKYSRSLQPLLTGRQNAKFICRINGYADDLEERLQRIEALSALGEKFDKAVSTYSLPMKSALSFALSMTFDFDLYVADVFNFAGGTAFRSSEAAESELARLKENAGLIMAVQGAQGEANLKRYCQSGIWLHEGKAVWYEDIHDAIDAYRAVYPTRQGKNAKGGQGGAPLDEEYAKPILGRMKRVNGVFRMIKRGLAGQPDTIPARDRAIFQETVGLLGMHLGTTDEAEAEGCTLDEDALPVVLVREKSGGGISELFDLQPQTVETIEE
jgi:capsular polysaccharide transport system ATP-binding protein